MAVIRYQGEWTVQSLDPYTGVFFGEPLSTLVTHADHRDLSFTLVFASNRELSRFLCGTSEQDEMIRSVVRIARHYGSPLALTQYELLSRLPAADRPEVKGHWASDLKVTYVDAGDKFAPKPLLEVDMFSWNFTEVATNVNAEFHFCRRLAYRWAANQVLRRRPQDLIPGHKVLVDEHRRDQYSIRDPERLIVPHDRSMPVTVASRSDGVWLPQGGGSYWATEYLIEGPPAPYHILPAARSTSQHAVPFDVLAAVRAEPESP